MDRRIWFLAIAVAVFCVGARRVVAPPSAAAGGAPGTGPRVPAQFVGAGSCSASACHNAHFSRGPTGSEFTSWMVRDRHARAYEILFDERSAKIQNNRQSLTRAHEDRLCLRCHVAPDFGSASVSAPAYFKTDGVGCESCHGPAKRWLPVHHLDAWKLKSVAQKNQLGMNDTRSLVGRAQICVTCHVGAPGMAVDHDLIAAGHPRLHFEFAAYHSIMPRHWPDGKDHARVNRVKSAGVKGNANARSEFEARAWLVGQLVTAHASLRLLADRAGDESKAWPEFADFDCAACHHDLRPISPKTKSDYRGRKPGALPWGHQVTLTPLALEALQSPSGLEVLNALREVRKAMDASPGQRASAAKSATRALAALQKAIEKLDARTITDASLEAAQGKLVVEATARRSGSYDEQMQIHLGLNTLRRAVRDGPRLPVSGLILRDFESPTLRRRLEQMRE